ncbi:MAG: putative ARF GTPase activator [Streblomastix strix]|uniref:Putative ARF GTPase activator n=1 Tax=Streblomastix strix TaxID=222440 RepID=A0A5J4WWB9_9EUKA|nr:MAG: putative ARF GTPase activator [Streblomastix strix]
MSSIDRRANENLIAILEAQLRLPGNRFCADCHAQGPRWTSTNIGIYICLSCSAIHRSMGTQYSKVKSVSMDAWRQDQVDFMLKVGNIRANSFWEAFLPQNIIRPTDTSKLGEFIRYKYITRVWVRRDIPIPRLYQPLGPNPLLPSYLSNLRSQDPPLELIGLNDDEQQQQNNTLKGKKKQLEDDSEESDKQSKRKGKKIRSKSEDNPNDIERNKKNKKIKAKKNKKKNEESQSDEEEKESSQQESKEDSSEQNESSSNNESKKKKNQKQSAKKKKKKSRSPDEIADKELPISTSPNQQLVNFIQYTSSQSQSSPQSVQSTNQLYNISPKQVSNVLLEPKINAQNSTNQDKRTKEGQDKKGEKKNNKQKKNKKKKEESDSDEDEDESTVSDNSDSNNDNSEDSDGKLKNPQKKQTQKENQIFAPSNSSSQIKSKQPSVSSPTNTPSQSQSPYPSISPLNQNRSSPSAQQQPSLLLSGQIPYQLPIQDHSIQNQNINNEQNRSNAGQSIGAPIPIFIESGNIYGSPIDTSGKGINQTKPKDFFEIITMSQSPHITPSNQQQAKDSKLSSLTSNSPGLTNESKPGQASKGPSQAEKNMLLSLFT